MIWLTLKQVSDASVTSLQTAVHCSIVHWQQILEAGPIEFLHVPINYGSEYCALCQRMYNHNKQCVCPLNKNCNTRLARLCTFRCCTEYYMAVQAMKCDMDTSHNVGESPNEWYDHTKVIINSLIERLRLCLV